MKKITSLTDEQIKRLPEFRKKWIDIGLSTSPANHPEAEDALRRAYISAGLDEPRFIVWMKNPVDCVMAWSLILSWVEPLFTTGKIKRDQVIDQVSDQVIAQVRAQVIAQVSDKVSAQDIDQVRAQVRDQVIAQVIDQVRDQVSDQVIAQVSDQVSAQVSDQVIAQ